VLLISPVIFGLVLKLSAQNLKSFKSLNPQTQFLMLTGPILLVVVLLLSFVQKVQGNWPMPFYFSGLILLAGTWVQGQWRNWLRYGLVLSYVMVLITYSLPSVIHALNWQDSKQDPTRRFRHWQQVADNVERVREAAIPDYANTMIIVMGHRDLVSELAFYLPDHPRVYRYSKEGVSSQYEIWPGPVSYSNANAMLISNSTEQPPAEVVNAFKSFHFVTDVANTKNPQYPYHTYYAEGLGQWPETGGEVSLED